MSNTNQQLDWWGANEEELYSEQEKIEPSMHWREAYELNKTRDICVLCNERTVKKQLFTSVFNFCSCVDDLAKLDSKY